MPGGRCPQGGQVQEGMMAWEDARGKMPARGAGARGYDGVGRCPGEDARKGEDARGKMRARGKMPGGRCPQGGQVQEGMMAWEDARGKMPARGAGAGGDDAGGRCPGEDARKGHLYMWRCPLRASSPSLMQKCLEIPASAYSLHPVFPAAPSGRYRECA